MKPIKLSLTLTLPLILLCSCSKPEAEVEKAAEYAKPAYTFADAKSNQDAVQFTDFTKNAGVEFLHETGAFGKKWMPETTGSGVGFLDYNSDGKPDLFIVNSTFWNGHEKSNNRPTQKLYRNLGQGKFKDVTKEAGLALSFYGMGCAFADYDSDGDMDIYISAWGDNKLMRNDKGKFKDVAAALKVLGNSNIASEPPAWSTGVAWVDIDRDGWLDLFVCNYVKWTPETDVFATMDGKSKSYATPDLYQGQSCRLYRNIKGKRFEDITKKAGVFNPEGKSLGVAIADFDKDGWPDLVISNDTQPNFLYMNNRDGTFTDAGLAAGVAYDEAGRARAGMGIDIADIKNSGELSIAIGNFSQEPLSLFTQTGGGLFQDMAGKARLNKPSLLSLTFGLIFQDLDLDGFVDLFIANGHVEPEINAVLQEVTYAQSPQIFINNKKGQFFEAATQVDQKASEPIVARGLASADIDNDGDLDLALTTNGGAVKLLRNDLSGSERNWLKISLKGKAPNRNAIGAKVVVYSGDLKQTKMLRTGSSYLSQSYIEELTFGLGSNTSVDSVMVQWPTTGKIDKFSVATIREKHIFSEK